MTSYSHNDDTELKALLVDVADEKERLRLTRAWQALAGLAKEQCATPAPSQELEQIFSGMDREMSDDELHLLAAAGIINGISKNDSLSSGNGMDFIEGMEGDDVIDESLNGGEGDDTLTGSDGDDVLNGGEGDDSLTGGDGDDVLNGDEGDDSLNGGTGSDTLDGGAGNDTLYGGFGSDNDVLTGGEGADTFVFGSNHGTDTITDFNPTEDSLNLLGAESMDNITVTAQDGNTVITFGDTTIILQGVEMTPEEVWARTVTS